MLSITNLLCLMILILSIMSFQRRELFYRLMHIPYEENRQKEYYRWISSAFVHRDWTHLLVNLIVLFSFGNHVERIYESIFTTSLSKLLFLILFIISASTACVPSYLKHRDNMQYSALGASGGVSGVLFVSIIFDPWNPVYLFGALPIWGILFGLLYLGYEYYASRNVNDNIGHDAHFWGAIAGIIFTIMIYPNVVQIFLRELIYRFPL